MNTASLPLPPLRKDTSSNCIPFADAGSSRSDIILEEWTSHDEFTPVYWDFAGSPHGELLIASTTKGIAFVGLTGDTTHSEEAIEGFKKKFPNNILLQERTAWHEVAIQRIKGWRRSLPIHLHLRNTPQLLMELCLGSNDPVKKKLCCG